MVSLPRPLFKGNLEIFASILKGWSWQRFKFKGMTGAIPLASWILFSIMLEYFSLVLKVKIKVTEAKHRTFHNRLIETLQDENTYRF